MGVLRTLGVGLLVVFLAVDLAVANAAIGLDRTVLDPEFVTETLEEEGAYENLQSVATDGLAGTDESSNAPPDQMPVSPDEVLAKAAPPDYLQGQVEANVERNLAYLHGNRDEPEIAIDLRPVKANVTPVVRSKLRNLTVAELFGSFAGEDATAAGGPFSMGLVVRMAENESAYRDARSEFRADLRAQVVDEFVRQRFENATDDELLALVIDDYDPDAYADEEKAAMVENREGEIRTELRAVVEAEAGAEIDARLSEQLSTYREEFRAGMESEMDDGSAETDPELNAAFADVVAVGIDGLTTEMTYEEYRTRLEAAKNRLADALAGQLGGEIDADAPDRVDLTAEMGQEDLDGLATARTAVRGIDLIAIGSPAFALVLVGGLWWLTRSPVATTLGPGAAALFVGGSGVLGATFAPNAVPAEASGPGVDAGTDLMLAIVDEVFGAFAVQSAVLASVGLALVAVAVAFKIEVLTVERLQKQVGL